MGEINYQCWICPFCYDDHASDGPCGEDALKKQITKLRNHLNDEYEKHKQRQTDTENHQRAKHQMREALSKVQAYLHWHGDDLSGDDLVGDGRLTASYKNILDLISRALT